MHPEITRQLAAQHIAELRQRGEQQRMLLLLRADGGKRPRRHWPRARLALRGSRPAAA